MYYAGHLITHYSLNVNTLITSSQCIFEIYSVVFSVLQLKYIKENKCVTQYMAVDWQLNNFSGSPLSSSLCSGMLPEAVLPPSKEHSYAQWLERPYQPKESRGPHAGKTDSLHSGVSHSFHLNAHGMETIGTCSVSRTLRNVFLVRTFGGASTAGSLALVCILTFIWSSFSLTGHRTSDLETEDSRQCALCQQYGDSVPSVS